MSEPQLETNAMVDANCTLRAQFEDCLQEVLAHQVFDGVQTAMPLGVGRSTTTGGGTQAGPEHVSMRRSCSFAGFVG